MEPADYYRMYAKMAADMAAADAADSEDRVRLLDMAQAWQKLADNELSQTDNKK